MSKTIDLIPMDVSKTLPGLFKERIRRSPDNIAYRYCPNEHQGWQDITWRQMAEQVGRWQAALRRENLQPGDRVGIILRNCPEWAKYDLAALGLGLITVPLYTNDRADNLGYIVHNADIKCILFEGEEHWNILSSIYTKLEGIQRFISLHKIHNAHDERIRHVDEWLVKDSAEYTVADITPDSLASIVYTSGTTGNPKGVMLSHYNIVWNAWSCVQCEEFYVEDIYLSFLPLSHMFERTVGYYMPMTAGSTVAYARSIEQLAEDLTLIKPTILVSVPRIFERVYNKIKVQLEAKSPVARKLFESAIAVGWRRFEISQGRAGWSAGLLFWPILNALVGRKVMAKLGGRIRMALSGGAPLSPEVSKTFIGLGLPLMQGYGMTELSPVAIVNRFEKNDPASVGIPIPDVEVRIGEQDELQIRCPGVMQGYWQNEQATRDTIEQDGWLHTGDVAKIENDFVYITGRIKDIIVLSNGEKVSPSDIELALANDSLIDQAMVVGETKPFLSAILVLNLDAWQKFAKRLGLDPDDSASLESETLNKALLERITPLLGPFPGYANIYSVKATLEPWSVESGMSTPTLKIKRNKLQAKYQKDIARFYAGH